MANAGNKFDENVFINCPFDPEYRPLLRAMLFTVIYCDLNPRIATEGADSGEVRIKKIVDLIIESKYSIHDISRIELLEGDLPRFNMPFELGIDFGCRASSKRGKLSTKKCLILEKERYRYRAVLSDISGNDIEAHDDDPERLVRRLSDWFGVNINPDVPSGTRIWHAYNEFNAAFEKEMENRDYDQEEIDDMSVGRFMQFVLLLYTPWEE